MTEKIKSCHGCCHEAAETCRKEHRHEPSGETACCLCIRNPDFQSHRSKFDWSKFDWFKEGDHFMTLKQWESRVKRAQKIRELRRPVRVEFT